MKPKRIAGRLVIDFTANIDPITDERVVELVKSHYRSDHEKHLADPELWDHVEFQRRLFSTLASRPDRFRSFVEANTVANLEVELWEWMKAAFGLVHVNVADDAAMVEIQRAAQELPESDRWLVEQMAPGYEGDGVNLEDLDNAFSWDLVSATLELDGERVAPFTEKNDT